MKITGNGSASVKASEVLNTKSVQEQLMAVTSIREQQEREMQWALGRIRDYSERHGLTPQQICDIFSFGIVAGASG